MSFVKVIVLLTLTTLLCNPVGAKGLPFRIEKSVEAKAFDLAERDYYGRLQAFLDGLYTKDKLLVIGKKRGKGKTLAYETKMGKASVIAHEFVSLGFRDKDIEVIQRVIPKGELPPSALVLYYQSGALMATGSGKWTKRILSALSKKKELPQKSELALPDLYAKARLSEGPLGQPQPPVPPAKVRLFAKMVEKRELGALVAAFRKARKEAKDKPGSKQHGKPWLGQSDYWEPSEAELVLAEAGKALLRCLQLAEEPPSALAMVRSLKSLSVLPGQLTFDTYSYSRVDAIGSGRFILPNPPHHQECNPIGHILKLMDEGKAFAKVRPTASKLRRADLSKASEKRRVLKEMEEALKLWDRAR